MATKPVVFDYSAFKKKQEEQSASAAKTADLQKIVAGSAFGAKSSFTDSSKDPMTTYNNAGQGVTNLVKGVASFGKEVLQGTAREVAAIKSLPSLAKEGVKSAASSLLPRALVSPVVDLLSERTGVLNTKPYTPGNKVTQAITGTDKPITMTGVGGELPFVDEEKRPALATGLGIALTAFDMSTLGLGKAARTGVLKIVNELAPVVSKLDDEVKIAEKLTENFHRVSPEAIQKAATDLKTITDPKIATKYLQDFAAGTKATVISSTPKQAASQIDKMSLKATEFLPQIADDAAADATKLIDHINELSSKVKSGEIAASSVSKAIVEAEDILGTLYKAKRSTDDLISQALAKVDNLVSGADARIKDLGDGRVVVDDTLRQSDEAVGGVTELNSRIQSAKMTGDDAARSVSQADAAAPEQLLEKVRTENYTAQTISVDELIKSDPVFAEYLKSAGDVVAAAPDAQAAKTLVSSTGEVLGNYDNLVAAIKGGNTKVDVMKGVPRTERGFSETVRTSARTSPELAKRTSSMYDPITNTQTVDKAVDILAQGDDVAMAFIHEKEMTAETAVVGQLLIEKFQRAGKIDSAVKVVETIAERATSQGQAIQALSLWNRLSPAGILKYASKELGKAGKALKPELARELIDDAARIKDMPVGWEKSFETTKMMKKVSDEIPVSAMKKVALTHTMMMLLNPKTFLRNIIGNLGFNALENVSDVAAAGLDSAVSLVTGVRTKVPPSILEQSRGAVRGGIEGWKEAMAGVNTMAMKTQFDIPKTQVFEGPVGKAFEKLLAVELRVPDRIFYQAAYDGSLYNQLKAANLTAKRAGKQPIMEATEQMREVAAHDALYRTFQDDTAISAALSGLKRGLNKLTGSEDFGLGDVVIKFPKTPGAILTRGIEYSPVGFVKTIYEASKPLMGKPFDQKKFVESFARATVGGTALYGTGALLGKLGIISGKSDDEADVAAAKRSLGFGNYKINVDALKRFAMSGMDAAAAKPKTGDTMVTYDWFQPAAIPLVMGANIGSSGGLNGNSPLGELFQAVINGADTLVDQPVLQGIGRYTENIGYYGFSEATGKLLASVPASFVPTMLNQIRQLTDNQSRNTYSKDVFEYATNLAKDRIPVLSQTNPGRVDPYGINQERYQDSSNNYFNVLFNPAFKTTYKDDPAVQMVLDIYNQTGDAATLPDVKRTKQKVNGKDVELGPKTYARFQKFVGSQSRFYLQSLADDPNFNKQSAQDKADYIAKTLRDIHQYGKIYILGDRPENISKRVRKLMQRDAQLVNTAGQQ